MSKHKPVFIQVDDLIDRLFIDSDDFEIEDALGINHDDPMPDLNLWVHVTWPEHISHPCYNGDASYGTPMTRNEAEKYDPEAVFYGE